MARNLLSMQDLSKDEVLDIFRQADVLRNRALANSEIKNSKIGGLLFFEPSTRTRIGFEVASWKMGYKTVFLDETKPSIAKGWSESMPDTIRTLNASVDFYFIRHPDARVFDQILPYTTNPVINCGNGHDEHPSQALIDAYAMWTKFGQLDGLAITLIGDLRYSRSTHSLMKLLSKFTGIAVQELAPDELRLGSTYTKAFEKNGSYIRAQKASWEDQQVVYSAGFPPINPSGTFPQSTVKRFAITKTIADLLPEESIILNPLPRIDEIEVEVDSSPKAYYFKQNELGLYVRMAIVQSYCGQKK
jgi:aspartate carbamoyltransferase catalytic subunit